MDVKDVSHQQNAGEQPTGGDKPQPTKTNETNNMVAIYHQTPDDLNAATESQAVVEAGNLQRIVILATARVRLQYGTDLSEPIRALMDAGGEISLITERCAKRLKLKMLSCHVPLKGVGGKAGILKRMVHVWLRPWFESDFVFPVFLYVTETWQTKLPRAEVERANAPFDHRLADEAYHIPEMVELLLGAEVWAEAVCSTIYRNRTGAMMQSSMLGCFALGRYELANRNEGALSVLNASVGADAPDNVENMLLADALKRFWQWEQAMDEKRQDLSSEELAAEKFFMESHYKDKQGREIHRYVRPIHNLCVKSNRRTTCDRQTEPQMAWHIIYRIIQSLRS